jgi:hypothetical protein
VSGAASAALYQCERVFPLEEDGPGSSYAIPLPPGSYRVHLHFAEVTICIKDLRRFDVLLEGETALEELDLMDAGFATAIEKVFERRVDDGSLEIRFVHRPPREGPRVSAIEVERVE